MAPRPKGSTKPLSSAPKRKAKISALLGTTPLVAIDKVQADARELRPLHPTLDDETVALCIAHISTRASIRQIAEELGASYSWCYARIARPETQAFLQQLALTSLGVAAARSILTLQELSENSTDERVRERAAIELLNRAGLGNSTTQQAQGVNASYAFSFAPPPEPADG